MTAPLPPGWSQKEMDDLFTSVSTAAQTAGLNWALTNTPRPLHNLMGVTLGVVPGPATPLPPGIDQGEWNTIYQTLMARRSDYVSQYIATRFPPYIQPNLVDQLAAHPLPPSGSPQAQSWAAKVTAQGGTVSATQFTRTDQLIGALNAGGILPKLDHLWLFAAESATAALVDVIGGAVATAINSPAFTANRGFAGDGT